jgi:hypothetical protein
VIKYTVYIDSIDSYSDIWPIYFDMFYKYWPEFEGTIFLNTETKTYQHDKFNIVCTKIGKFKDYGKRFRAGLDLIESDWVMYFPVDCIFMGEVDRKKLDRYFRFFYENQLDSFSLVYQSYRELKQTNISGISLVIPPSDNMFSTQISFWKKSTFYKMVLPHENPWSAEWYGTRRANTLKIKLACPSSWADNPLPYDLHGCLGRGKWLKNAIEHLNQLNYQVDYELRGFYVEPILTISQRLKDKWMIVRDGFRGSYWHPVKR